MFISILKSMQSFLNIPNIYSPQNSSELPRVHQNDSEKQAMGPRFCHGSYVPHGFLGENMNIVK